jgi:acetyl esterase/lipase
MKLLALLLLAAMSALPSDVRVEKDIAYLGADRKEKADLYLPAKISAGQRIPAVVIIHGGGWVGGDKAMARELNIGGTLASHGYAALSINYLLGPKANGIAAWPQNLHDCKTAVRWLRVNADRYHLDPAHIGVIGGSAGGHLSAMVGVTQSSDGLEPKEPYGSVPSSVSCVVDLYGPLYMKTGELPPGELPVTAVLRYLDKNDPPFLILHGTADKTVAVERSRELDAALARAGIEHQLVIIEEAPHSFHLQPKQRDLRPLVLGFFDKYLKPGTKGTP